MQTIQTEVLVIGGGATGTGILRDLAMRGFKTVLVEKGDLTQGTTGRYHGLLHSGARYAVKDPDAARECIQENMILRKIMPQCIEDTGGFFVTTPWDDPGYAPRFLEGCLTAGIPIEEISISQMLHHEPLLNSKILRCFQVPDASADSFLGAHLNVLSAQQHGAQVLTYHKVERLILSGNNPRRVVGALCTDLKNGAEYVITADLVINASGAWAGKVAHSAGLEVKIIPGKGTMLAVNHRVVHTVINRCRMPGDGDILVPAHTVSVIGTTDVKVTDPDRYSIEPWEVRLCLEEGEKILPGFKQLRFLRAWAGVRPLYQETSQTTENLENRAVTRAFVLLDHETRDGVPGLLTITSGKWTTYRKMAEATVDLACAKLGVERPCRTHLEALPDPHHTAGYHSLGARLAEIEKNSDYGKLVCECELVTREEVEAAILSGESHTIDDIRRDVRLGMGPCQAGFCAYRAAGIILEIDSKPDTAGSVSSLVEETNASLRDFLQERWKGLLPILWGQQHRQTRLDELVYLDVLNLDHLPGPVSTALAPINYTRSEEAVPTDTTSLHAPITINGPEHVFQHAPVDIVVTGAGLAGLASAWQASRRGYTVHVISKGWGATHWSTGCISVLGYDPWYPDVPIAALEEALERISRRNPEHPYAIIGMNTLKDALQAFLELCEQSGYPYYGSIDQNWLLPSALGAARPVCLAPSTFIAGDMKDLTPALIVGFPEYPDFYPHLIAANLAAQGIPAKGILLELDLLHQRRFSNSRSLAQAFDTQEFRTQVSAALRPKLGNAGRIGFPAVLGLRDAVTALRDMQRMLGVPVFEIPTTPPSIPGMRLHDIFIQAIEKSGCRIDIGMNVVGADIQVGRIHSLFTEAAARRIRHPANWFVVATGGILGGGITTQFDGSLSESIFDIPVMPELKLSEWFQREFLSPLGHPIHLAGLQVDQRFHPSTKDGSVLENVFVVGGNLAYSDPIRERSLEGIALASGYLVGNQVGTL